MGCEIGGRLLAIGKMAAMNHTTVPTLRLYDRLGLLKPRHVDTRTGYRYYDIQQNARFDLIEYMKELGMSLKEIASVLDCHDSALVETILAQKNEQIRRQMRGLKLRHDAIERAISSLERYRKSPVTGTIALEYIDRRLIYGIPCPEDFYSHDISSYERDLMCLRQDLMDKGIPQIHTYSVGTSIRKDVYECGHLQADRVFIFADKALEDYHLVMDTIDSGMYACIYLDSYDKEIEGASMLLEHCRRENLTIIGDYICEVLTEFNVFDDEKRGMFLRLQVPVDFTRKIV